MAINGLQLGGLMLYAGPEITGGQLGLSLLGIGVLIFAIIKGYQAYLSKKTQELINTYSDNPESNSALVRKYKEVDTKSSGSSVLLGGLVAGMLGVYLIINLTNVTYEREIVYEDIPLGDEMMVEPPNTPPEPPPPPTHKGIPRVSQTNSSLKAAKDPPNDRGAKHTLLPP